MRRKFSALIIILILIMTPAAAKKSKAPRGNIDSQIAAEERKRADLAKQAQAYRDQVRRMGRQVEGLLTKVNTLQQDESIAEQELTVLELQSEKIQENIEVLDEFMKGEQVKIDELSQKMSERLVDMYKYGETGRMRTLFASRSVFEAVEDAYLLKLLNERDEDILSELHEKVQNMDLSRRTMDDHQTRLKEKSQAVQEQREKYNQTIKDTNRFITSLQRQKA